MGERHLPPGPRSRNVVSTAAGAVRYLPGFLERVARDHGDVACIVVGPLHVYVLSSPAHAQDLLETNEHRFEKARGEQRFGRRLLEEGVLVSEGGFHRRQHRLLYPAVHGEALERHAGEMVAGARRMASAWRDGDVVEVFDLLSRTTTDVMVEVMFGRRVDEPPGRELSAALAEAVDALEHLPAPFLAVSERLPLGANRRFDRAEARLDSLVGPVIARARSAGPAGGGVVADLVRARDDDGAGMDDAQVNSEALSIFRGHRTAGTALCWMWYLLSRHPGIEEQVLAEIDAVVGDREPTAGDYAGLGACRRVFDEAERLFPGAWLTSRRAVAEHEFDGYRVPVGATVITSSYVIHRDPRFHSEPRRFDPGRFLPERRAGWHPFAYFPFGGGSKRCLGDEFAPFEAVLFLAEIGRRWRLRPVPGHPVAPAPKATFRPRGGMWLRLERR
ncbi:MAG TPA: cytochrome P450 [Actinomycetota bacterium]|jgi:cytochrome P450